MMTHNLAQAAQPNLFGWYLGFAIGIVIVAVVVALVGPILYLALKISKQALVIDDALKQSYRNTAALADLSKTINHAGVIVDGLHRARTRLGG